MLTCGVFFLCMALLWLPTVIVKLRIHKKLSSTTFNLSCEDDGIRLYIALFSCQVISQYSWYSLFNKIR